MRKLARPAVSLSAAIGLLLSAALPAFSGQPADSSLQTPRSAPSVPLFFRNAGNGSDLVVAASGLRARFSASAVSMERGDLRVQVRFPGSRDAVDPEGLGVLPGKVNLLLGDDPAGWRTGLETYERVVYRDLYPGIDVVYSGEGMRLKSEFLVRPGADPSAIRLAYEGVGPPELEVDGALVVHTHLGVLRELAPRLYQEERGNRTPVDGEYILLEDNSVGLRVGSYDASQTLVIDPEMTFSTYLGGSGIDNVSDVALDAEGNIYLTGWTESSDFPTVDAIQDHGGSNDVFVVKLNGAGSAIVFATFIGGSSDDRANALSVDATGSVAATGFVNSVDFPTASAMQGSLGGGRDAFVLKLNSAGDALMFSTYLGGSGQDSGNGIAVDSAGAVYLTGDTYSGDFPILGAYQNMNAGAQDGFVTKLSRVGSLLYSTHLGGSDNDIANSVAVDTLGQAYVTGGTSSSDFPVLRALQSTKSAGQDAFITKLTAAGNQLMYSTFFGGTGGLYGSPEQGADIAVDGSGYAYVAGTTSSSQLTATGYQATFGGGSTDAFLAELAIAGNSLVYSTYFGGIGNDYAAGVALQDGSAIITGHTSSPNLPIYDAFQPANAGLNDAYLAKFGLAGTTLEYSTYFGGAQMDGATAVVADGFGGVVLAGVTQSADLPILAAIQGTNAGTLDSFVARFGEYLPQAPEATSVSPSSGSGSSQTFQFTYSDDNGYQELGWLHAMFQNGIYEPGSCHIQYQQGSDALWLRNDAGTSWLGPITPGQSGSLANSQCTLDGPSSSVSGSGSALTLDLALTFQPAFSGTKYIYMFAADTTGLNSGWQQRGTWTTQIPTAPQALSVSPSSGSGTSQTFQFVYSDANGYEQIGWAHAMFQTAVNQANACYAYYLRSGNSLWLRNDAGTAWLGPVTPGQAGSLTNSQCTLGGQASSVSGSGDTLTINLALTFDPAFAGQKNVYMFVADTTGLNSGWQYRGTWNTQDSQAPEAVSVAPSSGSGSSQTFQFTYSDGNGYQQMGWAYAMIQSSISQAGACYAYYYASGNSLWLRNDEGTAWLGPITPGQKGTLANSQCTLDGPPSSVSGSDNTLTLNLALAFQPSFVGTKNVYMFVADTTGLNSGWQQRGTWNTTEPQAPEAVSVSPLSGTGSAQTFQFTYSDANGYQQMGWTYLMFQTAVDQVSACYAYYHQGSNALWLRNDAGTAWVGPVTPGQAGSLANSQCTLDGPSSSVSGSGCTLTLNPALTFEPVFAGTKNVYMYAADTSGLNSGWVLSGEWTPNPEP